MSDWREWWPENAEEAEAMRPEIAAFLRGLAAAVEAGEVKFRTGDKITISFENGEVVDLGLYCVPVGGDGPP